MVFNLTSVITALAGTIIGFLLKTIYDYFKYLSERKDKYFFVLITKRFEVYQQANFHCEKLKKVIHDKTDKKYEITTEAREWFYNNSLYLKPELREDFRRLILDVEFYGDTKEDFYFTLEDKGADDEETIKKRADLRETFNNIMVGAQKKIQDDIDIYYSELK